MLRSVMTIIIINVSRHICCTMQQEKEKKCESKRQRLGEGKQDVPEKDRVSQLCSFMAWTTPSGRRQKACHGDHAFEPAEQPSRC